MTADLVRLRDERRQALDRTYPVSFTTDPGWLVEQAINRRAARHDRLPAEVPAGSSRRLGWVEDPHTRGSCLPVNGRLPRKACGDWQRHLRLIAREVNTPRLIVRYQRLGEHQWLADRIPHRIERSTDA